MLRTTLLGGNSITLDADMSKYIETVSDQGVIEGLEVSSGSVAPGKAWVKATRSNGETIMVLVQNTQAQSISLNGDVFVGIEIDQNAINNGALNNEDGTGIASIKVSPSKPSQNYLVLAVNQGGRLTDQRAMIPKIQSVAQRTTSLEQKMQTQEQKVERLEEAGLPEYIGKKLVVEESYQEGEEMIERQGKLYHRYIAFRYTYQNENWGGLSKNIGQHDLKDSNKIAIEIDNLSCYWGSNSPRGFILVVGKRFFSSQQDVGSSPDEVVGKSPIGRGSYKKTIIIDKNRSGQVYITLLSDVSNRKMLSGEIKILGVREDDTPNLLPRNVAKKGNKVECTIQGIHSNGKFYNGYSQKKLIGKIVAGRATVKWTAPSGGILVYEAMSYQGYGGQTEINGVNVIEGASVIGNMNFSNGQIFVPKGDVTIQTAPTANGDAPYINLLYFIPL